jgi:hypothetical protein
MAAPETFRKLTDPAIPNQSGTVATNDLIHTVDVSDTTDGAEGTSKRTTVEKVTANKVSKAGDTMTGVLGLAAGTAVASATNINIFSSGGNSLLITGTTSIESLGTLAAGAIFNLIFEDELDLVYDAVSLILPTGANITTATGDCAQFLSLGSGNWKCTAYTRADGTALSGGGNADMALVIDTTVAALIGDISGFSVNPKAIYRLTDAVAGVVRVFGVTSSSISMSAFLEGAWDGATFVQGAWGRYAIGEDWFIPTSNQYPYAPVAANDIDYGYVVGDLWIDTADFDKIYKCTDNTTGAAVWEAQSGSWTPTLGSASGASSNPLLVIASFNRVGNIVNCIIQGTVDVDFSTFSLGEIEFTFPITTTTSNARGCVTTSEPNQCNGFVRNDKIALSSLDTSFVSSVGFYATFQYEIN